MADRIKVAGNKRFGSETAYRDDESKGTSEGMMYNRATKKTYKRDYKNGRTSKPVEVKAGRRRS